MALPFLMRLRSGVYVTNHRQPLSLRTSADIGVAISFSGCAAKTKQEIATAFGLAMTEEDGTGFKQIKCKI